MSEAAVEAEKGGGEESVQAPVAPLPTIFATTSAEAAGSAPGAALEPAGPEAQLELVLAPEAAAQSHPEPAPEPEPAALTETDQDRDRRNAREMMQRRYSQQGSPAPLRSDSRGLSMTLDTLLTSKFQVRTSAQRGSLAATALPMRPPTGSVACVRSRSSFSSRAY